MDIGDVVWLFSGSLCIMSMKRSLVLDHISKECVEWITIGVKYWFVTDRGRERWYRRQRQVSMVAMLYLANIQLMIIG